MTTNEEPEIEAAELPLPESQRELELLLEALHALNDTISESATVEAAAPPQ